MLSFIKRMFSPAEETVEQVVRQQYFYFFCGVGGSGMMPLALLLAEKGHLVAGSDRSYDQGKTPEKFEKLISAGIELLPQDGSGISKDIDYLVVSSAVEESVPDVRAALDLNIPIIKRGQLLAEYFNHSDQAIAVAGTSGKSTVTAMIGTILIDMGVEPTVVNGGGVKNFSKDSSDGYSSIYAGNNDIFVAEMDESDGSIAHYNPTIAALNNISLDHKSMEELEELFGGYLEKAQWAVVVNHDDERVMRLCAARAKSKVISYSVCDSEADLFADDLKFMSDGVHFCLSVKGHAVDTKISVPGRHNVLNALSALSICKAMGLDLNDCLSSLEKFKGVHRRMELVGQSNGVTVYDDFGHNPDKIEASLETLKAFDGRLVVMFQPHGFGPLRLMGDEIVNAFAEHLEANDILVMPEVYYAGGTVDRSVTAKDIIHQAKGKGVDAHWFASRDEIPQFLSGVVQDGDRIVVMGARDDTLHDFANGLLRLF